MLAWITPATLTGCPATSAPVGLSSAGPPVGVQSVGPFPEAAVPIQLAGLLQDLTDGFVPPPTSATDPRGTPITFLSICGILNIID
jgi:amidase